MGDIILRIPISCGETTCAKERGVFCQFLFTEKFGSRVFCNIFSELGGYKSRHVCLEEKDGWVQRHPDCIKYASTQVDS